MSTRRYSEVLGIEPQMKQTKPHGKAVALQYAADKSNCEWVDGHMLIMLWRTLKRCKQEERVSMWGVGRIDFINTERSEKASAKVTFDPGLEGIETVRVEGTEG